MFGDDEGEGPAAPERDHAMVIDISDGWLLQGAWLPPHPRQAVHAGQHQREPDGGQDRECCCRASRGAGREGWLDHMRGLVDIGIAVGEDEPSFFKAKLDRPPGAELGRTSCCATSAGISVSRGSSPTCGSPRT